MNTSDAISARRAIKHYDSSYQITEEEIQQLFSLVVLSPTSFNIQNWRFVIVSDIELRKKLRAASYDQAQVTDASLFVILCADIKAWEKSPQRYWKNTSSEVSNFVLPALDGFYRGHEQLQRDEAIRSCGIASQTLMLAAKSMGYDSCPMIGFDSEAVGRLINLPSDHIITMFVAVGKGIKEAWPRGGQLQLEEVLIRNSF